MFVVFSTVLLLLSLAVNPIMASASSQIDFTLLRYEPMPVEPGKYVNVFIKVENPGNTRTNEITLEFVDNYPLGLP